MFYARRYLESYWNTGETLLVVSLNIRKAFDMVSLDSIEVILKELGVPQHIVNRVRQALNCERASILWEGIETEQKSKAKGIKQGCPMSPYIFTLIKQKVLKQTQAKIPTINLLEINRKGLPVILAFADDLLLMVKTVKEIEEILKVLKFELERVGLELNVDKSKVLIREPRFDRKIPENIILNGEKFDVTNTLKYLGTYFTENLDRPKTTRIRCRQAIICTKIVIEFMKKFKPSWHLAKLIYKTGIEPAITYGLKAACLVKRNRQYKY